MHQSKCFLCEWIANKYVKDHQNKKIYLCNKCRYEYFTHISENERFQYACHVINFSKEHQINHRDAIRVLQNKLGLTYAKRNKILLNRERNGKSNDIFYIAKRVSGSFKSKK